MKDYLLFMDVSGDVSREYVDADKVELLPMEFIINGKAENYTDKDDGINVIDFYKSVKARADIVSVLVKRIVVNLQFGLLGG